MNVNDHFANNSYLFKAKIIRRFLGNLYLTINVVDLNLKFKKLTSIFSVFIDYKLHITIFVGFRILLIGSIAN